jgi:hypothetical protein
MSSQRLGCILLLVAGALAAPVLGTEITVKNDSYIDGGSAIIVGDFIAGEQAGARLTSTAAGYIVAVQVAWLEGTPGHGQSIEQAIHVYAGTAFPTPGTELALLEGPVMTPGYINEFRYLDEAQTIPIHVPVTNGQQFYVSLQFDNPTNVGSGGPSVVRDTNGCQANKNVIYAIPGGWFNACLLGIQGDFIIRAVIQVADPTGACCYGDGTCASGVTQADCVSHYAAIWTSGVSCAQVTCNARGACCRAGGCLSLQTPAVCQSIGGIYAGNATNCADNVCVAGACCQADGSCIQNFGFQCAALGGTYHGTGSTCNPNPCPQPTGACCFGEICIPDQANADCTGAGGTWKGALSVCTPNPCAPPPQPGACCFGSVCLAGQLNADCTGAGGTWMGAQTACTPNPCGPQMCTGDTNCDGGITFADIDRFVEALSGESAWTHAPCPWRSADCNHDGGVTFADIDGFVALIGTACP